MTIDGRREIKTFDLLDKMLAVLDTTNNNVFLWPFLESTGGLIQSYGDEDEALTPGDSGANGFHPYRHPGGVYSLHFEAGDDQHLAGADAANLSFAAGTDAPFSVGCWFYIDSGTGTLISKYDVAGTLREWKLAFVAGPDLTLLLYDEDVDKEEGAETTAALSTRQWYFGVGTYGGAGGEGGGEAAADIILYVDGSAVADTTVEDVGYVDMEDTAAPLMIGATDDATTPASEFTGRIALPFIVNAELSAAQVLALYSIGKTLLGV